MIGTNNLLANIYIYNEFNCNETKNQLGKNEYGNYFKQ